MIKLEKQKANQGNFQPRPAFC